MKQAIPKAISESHSATSLCTPDSSPTKVKSRPKSHQRSPNWHRLNRKRRTYRDDGQRRQSHYRYQTVSRIEPRPKRGLFPAGDHQQHHVGKSRNNFCPTNWSKDIRHLHKLPIPEFDPNNPDHADLSRLGRRAAVEAENVIAGLGDPVPSVTKARSVLRHEWQPNSGVARGLLR